MPESEAERIVRKVADKLAEVDDWFDEVNLLYRALTLLREEREVNKSALDEARSEARSHREALEKLDGLRRAERQRAAAVVKEMRESAHPLHYIDPDTVKMWADHLESR